MRCVLVPRRWCVWRILTVTRTHELAPEQVRKEFHDLDGGLRLQLGAQVGALADDVWAGVLRHRDDRVFDRAVRYRALWVGGISAQPTAVGSNDRLRDGHAEDGAGGEENLRADARAEVGDFDGRVLVGRRAVQYLCRAAGRRPHRADGCVCDRMPAASGEFVLRAAEAAGQDRHYDAGQAADRSAAGREHDGEFQAAGDGGADDAAEVAVSCEFSVVSSQLNVKPLLDTFVILSAARAALAR